MQSAWNRERDVLFYFLLADDVAPFIIAFFGFCFLLAAGKDWRLCALRLKVVTHATCIRWNKGEKFTRHRHIGRTNQQNTRSLHTRALRAVLPTNELKPFQANHIFLGWKWNQTKKGNENEIQEMQIDDKKGWAKFSCRGEAKKKQKPLRDGWQHASSDNSNNNNNNT